VLLALQLALAAVILMTALSAATSWVALWRELGLRCVAIAARLMGHPLLWTALVPSALLASSAWRWVVSLAAQRRAAAALVARVGLAPELPVRLQATADRLGLAGRVAYSPSPAPLAFCFGVRRPRIVVTRGLVDLLDDSELGAVIGHEGHHARRHDPLRLALARAAGRALGYLPGMQDLVQHFVLLTEIAADRAAIAQAGSRRALASAVVKLAAQPIGPRESLAAVSGFGAGPGRVGRLDALLAERCPLPQLSHRTIVLPAVALVAIGVASAVPVLASGHHHVEMVAPCPVTAASAAEGGGGEATINHLAEVM
jgi:Zn-dependent protease with chaperone function